MLAVRTATVHLAKLLVGFIRNAELVQRDGVHEALHDRVEEAGVAPVLHRMCHPLTHLVHIRAFQQFHDGGRTRLLHFAFEI